MAQTRQVNHRRPRVAAGRQTTGPVAGCTIIARNYLSYASVLAASYFRHMPTGRFYLLVVDDLPDGAKVDPRVRIVRPVELNVPRFWDLCFKYDVTELSTAVKPALLSMLMEKFGEKRVAYFDPDILIMRPLTELEAALDSAGEIVLTPHLLQPIPDDGLKPTEQDILRDGAFNLGFIALRQTRQSREFLDWWSERLRDGCRIDPARGLFTDQKWIDLVPGYFPAAAILRDPTYNVAYWNLHSRAIGLKGGRFVADGKPIAFFHFSGFNPARPGVLSKHQTRIEMRDGSPLARLLNDYANLQREHGHAESSQWEYGYLKFTNGVPVHPVLRQLYLQLDPASRHKFDNPFHVNGDTCFFHWATHPCAERANLSPFLHEIYRSRYDVAASFPDVSGRDRQAFFSWAVETGAKEMKYDSRLVGLREEAGTRSNGARSSTARAKDSAWRAPRIDAAGIHGEKQRLLSKDDYGDLIERIRAAASSALPADATVLVVSKGDEKLLDLAGRRAWHFPRTEDGTYAGYNPVNGSQAVAHLEALRAKGAGYLLLPATALWWLEHYREFGDHLATHYEKLLDQPGTCVIFNLNDPQATSRAGEWAFNDEAEQITRPFGVNVAGYLSSEKGLGEGVRSDVRSLQAVEIPFVLNNFVDGGSRNIDQSLGEFSADNPYAVNLVHVNADQAGHFARSRGEAYFKGHYSVGYWAWELCDFPEQWQDRFQYFDEIWVPSEFTLDAVSRSSPVPVLKVPHSLPEKLPMVPLPRERFKLPPSTFLFLFMFDCHSILERKNPLGLIKAFKKAFGRNKRAALVLKCSHATAGQLRTLHDATRGINAHIIDDVLTREETNSLLGLCDCYVSLHRSEGFGLTIAEAMSLGRPVIATGFSGNIDFMTAANSFPVKYSLVEIAEDQGPYKAGSVWAEPDLTHAAELMRYVFEHRTAAAKVAARGRDDVQAKLRPAAVGRRIQQRLAKISAWRRSQPAPTPLANSGGLPVFDPAVETVSPSAPSPAQLAYEQLLIALRDIVRAVVPQDATVLVVSKGDEKLLDLPGRRAWHFPRTEDGTYAGYHPADSAQATAHIAALCEQGASYLLLPRTSFWWLEHYPEFRQHLETQGRRVWSDGHCIIYRLSGDVTDPIESGFNELRRELGEVHHSHEHLAALSAAQAAEIEKHAAEASVQTRAIEDLARHVALLTDTFAARPYMSRDAFGMGDLSKPMGYGLDATDVPSAQQPLDFAGLFRGPEELIVDRQRVYLPFLRDCRKVIDLGCGRGEFLRLLRDNGIPATGVELDADLANHLKERGFDAIHGDGVEYIRGLAEGSVDAIFSAQVIEHLEPARLAELLSLCRTRLKQGGVFIAETVNPESIQALKVFYVDLTHQRPLYPQVVLYMCRQAEFRTARIFYPVGGGFTQEMYQTAGEYAVIAVA